MNLGLITDINAHIWHKHLRANMMEQGNFSIDWKDFKSTSTKRFEGFVGKDDFSDVTLVCGDGQRIPGHQVILATGCTFFKNLLEEEHANPKPLIFLRGVEAALLQPLLLFLYTGKAEISETLITEFLILAEDLGIEGLAKNPEKDNEAKVPDLTEDLGAGRLTKNLKKEREDEQTSMEETLRDVSGEKDKNSKLKMCPMCNRAFNDASNLKRHITSHSKGRLSSNAELIKVPARSEDGFFHCQYCEKEVKDGSNIRRHIRNMHQNKNDQKHFDVSA